MESHHTYSVIPGHSASRRASYPSPPSGNTQDHQQHYQRHPQHRQQQQQRDSQQHDSYRPTTNKAKLRPTVAGYRENIEHRYVDQHAQGYDPPELYHDSGDDYRETTEHRHVAQGYYPPASYHDSGDDYQRSPERYDYSDQQFDGYELDYGEPDYDCAQPEPYGPVPPRQYNQPAPPRRYAEPPPPQRYTQRPPLQRYAEPPPSRRYTQPPPLQHYAEPPPPRRSTQHPPAQQCAPPPFSQPSRRHPQPDPELTHPLHRGSTLNALPTSRGLGSTRPPAPPLETSQKNTIPHVSGNKTISRKQRLIHNRAVKDKEQRQTLGIVQPLLSRKTNYDTPHQPSTFKTQFSQGKDRSRYADGTPVQQPRGNRSNIPVPSPGRDRSRLRPDHNPSYNTGPFRNRTVYPDGEPVPLAGNNSRDRTVYPDGEPVPRVGNNSKDRSRYADGPLVQPPCNNGPNNFDD